MADAMSGPITRCPWCSAALPAPDVERCPACGATLTSATGTEPQLPGVTTLDAEAIIRGRSEVPRPRNRILSFITGEVAVEAGDPAEAASFAPPSDDVRREMLRLKIEAERADLEAETVALKSDVLAQQGIHVSQISPADAGEDASGSPAEDASGDRPEDGEPVRPEDAEPAGPDDGEPAPGA